MHLNKHQIEEQWQFLKVLLILPADKIDFKIQHYRITEFRQELMQSLLDQLSDHQLHKVDELCDALKDVLPAESIFKILTILNAREGSVIAQPDAVIDKAAPSAKKFSAAVLDRALTQPETNYLTSPVYGGALTFNNVELLFLCAHQKQLPQDDWQDFAWKILQKHS